jgi:PAS domain S-box-containing protein
MKSGKTNSTKQNKKKPTVPNKNNFKNLSFLKSSELLLDQLGDGVIIVDKSSSIISINSKAEELFGKKKTLLLKEDVSKFINLDKETNTQDFAKSLQKFLASRKKLVKLKNCKLILSKNKFLPVNCSITRIVNENSDTEIAAIILSLGKENYKTTKMYSSDNNNTSEFVYELPGFLYRCANNKNWTMKFISDGCTDITGYEPEEFIENKKIAFNDIIHPDYRKPIRKKWQRLLTEKKYFEFEYPIITKKKDVRWVWERGKGIYSDKGKLLYLEGFITDITERKNTEAMLLLKNTVFESSISGNSIADIKGRITNLNAAFLNLLGYKSKSAVIGKNISDFFENKKIASSIIKALNTTGRWEGEFSALRKDGSSFLAYALATSVHDSEGRKIGYQSSVLDITERKIIEQEVEKNRDRMQLLVEGTPHLFFYVQNLDGYIEYISPSIENITGYKVSQWLNQRHWFITESPINQKARSRTHRHLSGEIDPSPVYVEIKHANGGKVTLELYERPIVKNGKVIGLQGVAHDITERLKSEEKLRISELSYQKLFDSVTEAIYIQDENGVFIDVNEGAVEMYGYDKKTLIGKTPEFVSAPNRNDIQSVQIAVKKAFKGEKQQFQFWGKRKNGEEFLKDVRLYPAAHGDKRVIIAIATDITEMTKAQTLLKESEERFKNLFVNSPDAIFLADPKTGIIVDVNESAMNLMKMKREQIIGMHQSKLHPPKFDEFARKSFEAHQRTDGVKIAIETYILNSDREEIPVEVMANRIMIQGQELLQGVFRDLTQRKLIEAQKDEALLALKVSEEKYRTLAENINDAIYSIDRTGRFTYVSTAVKHILGYNPQDIVGKNISDFVYPEDLKLFPQQIRKIISNTLESSDYRLIEKSGAVHWVRSSGKAIYENGKITGFQGVMIDINNEKIFEKKLKFSEQRYRIISNLTSDYLFSTLVDESGDHKMEWVAGSFEKITGYTIEEYVKAGGWRATLPPDELKKDDLDLERLKQNLKVNREVKTYHKDGSVVWVRTYAQPLWDEQTKTLRGVYGAVQDITEQKNNEESMRMMAHMLDIAPNAISVYDFNGKCLYVNQTAARMHGYSIEEYKKLNLKEIDAPASSELIEDRIKLINTSGEAYFEVNHLRKDKSEIPLEIFVKKVEWVGIPALLSIATDITERKKYIEALKEERDLFSSGPVSTIIWAPDENWPIKYVSSNIAEILGYSNYFLTAPEFNYSSLIHPDDLPRIINEVKYYADNSIDTFEQSYRLRHKNGNYLWIYDYTKFVRDNSGNIIEIKGYLFDQTNLKNAQQEIENQKQRLANIIEGTNVGTWEWNVQTGETVFNERWAEIIGYTLEELKPISIHTWLRVVHPDDLVKSEELLLKHFKGETEYYDFEARVKHKAGHWVWIADKGKVVSRTADKKPLMMFGTHQDITERKRSEILQHIQYKVADAAVSSIRLTDLFESIRSELSTIMNVNNFFIALYDEKSGMLNSDVDRDEMEIIPEWPAKGSMTGYVIEQKRSVLVTKNQINHMIADGIAGMVGIIPEIWLGVPFRIGGKVIGVIVVQSYDNPNAYDHNSVEILEIVAHELSIFIQHKRAEEETQKLSKAIVQSPVSIIITDPQGKIEYVNPKFTEVSGYAIEEIKGETPRVLRTDEHGSEFFSKMWETISSGKDWQGEIRNRKKNGEIYWDAALISPILNDEGRITNYLAINEDITEKKKMIEELIIAKEKAEEMNRVKSNFFANMSHELRTPMVGILGFSEMLMTEFKDKPDYFTMIKSINSSGQRLLETLNMILNISKLEAAKVEPVLTATNIVPLIRESYQFFESAASRKKLQYELSVLDDRILCNIDAFLFLSIINNLINNAIKFTSAGAITVVVQISNSDAVIRVSDSGVGISQENLNLIWEEFRQASEGYNRSFEGTGLGLSISKRYTELMKGKINVESVIDKGTTFILTFPLVEEIIDNVLKESSVHPSSETIKIIDNAPKVLYVEDDEVSIKLVRTVTKGLYEIDTAKDSDEALELIKLNKYGLILMDINLHKGMDGIELTQLIRKQEYYKSVPVIALTAFAMGHEKEEFLAKGMTHYLSKPFTRNQLLEILNDAFKPKDN